MKRELTAFIIVKHGVVSSWVPHVVAQAVNKHWDGWFSPPGVGNTVAAIAVSGSDVEAGGALANADGTIARHIAK